jgi:predicted protein tyrosine phosphatase
MWRFAQRLTRSSWLTQAMEETTCGGMIYVSSYLWMRDNVGRLGPGHLISLMDSCAGLETPPGIAPSDHLKIDVHDIAQAMDGYTHPSETHIRQLLDFGARWSGERSVLVHCMAGVSRSAATGFILACQRNEGREEEVARLMRARGGWVSPNPLMVAIADDLLGRDGRLVDALRCMGMQTALFPRFPLALPLRLDAEAAV